MHELMLQILLFFAINVSTLNLSIYYGVCVEAYNHFHQRICLSLKESKNADLGVDGGVEE
jgi:hypothetical protein